MDGGCPRDTQNWMDTLVDVFCVLLDVHAVSKFVEEGGGWSCSVYPKNKDGSLCVYVGVTGFIFFVDKMIRWTVVVRATRKTGWILWLLCFVFCWMCTR